jgi:hypothetical protein
VYNSCVFEKRIFQILLGSLFYQNLKDRIN